MLHDRWYQRWTAWLRFLDLTSDGHPSFSKFVCLAVLVASIAQRNMTLGIVIALLSASFGRSMWLAFLKRSSVNTSETVTREHRVIEERRDPVAGIEPAP